jgi:LPS sulfotransferase NodH
LLPVLNRIEQSLVRRSSEAKWPPVFIVGPTRSGSTLLYQSLVQAFDVCYLSNAMCRFARLPATVGWMTSWFGGCTPPTEFSSRYGTTEGWRAPAQGDNVLSRWFPRNGEYAADVVWSEESRSEFVGTIAAIENAYDAPLINKWPGLGLAIGPLVEAIPNALFVRLDREDDLQMAQSILRTRLDLCGDPYRSSSRLPRDCAQFKDRDYIDQILAYVVAAREAIDAGLATVASERCLRITYEAYCSDPRGFADRFASWYNRFSKEPIARRGTLPEKFKASTQQRVSDEDFQALRERLPRFGLTTSQ